MRIEPLERRRRPLRLAPLVDVVFLLLVFFMLVARLERHQAIVVDPPAEAGVGALRGSVLVRLGIDGQLDLNGRPLVLDQLPQALAPFLRREPQPPVLVQPSTAAALQSLVRLLDVLSGVGADQVTLVAPSAAVPGSAP
jgi:biopolymer transport protein ExbD